MCCRSYISYECWLRLALNENVILILRRQLELADETHFQITRCGIPMVAKMRIHLHALLSVSSRARLIWTPVGVCHWQKLPPISSYINSPDETAAYLSHFELLSGCPQHVVTATVPVASFLFHPSYKSRRHIITIATHLKTFLIANEF